MDSNNVVVLWNSCLRVISDNISAEAFKTWFVPIKPLSYENNELKIEVPSQFFYEFLEEHYVDLLRMTLYRVFGKNTSLRYTVLMSGGTINYLGETKSIDVERITPKDANKAPIPFRKTVPSNFDSQLNPKYTFDNFFEGESNKLARTAGVTVARDPGKTAFNPLFIHGMSGVGKTHLCHAIGTSIKEQHPEKRVLYVSAHLFKVQFADAGRYNTINDFINFYQGIDVLIIDDIQELAGIEKTQNTFFHIFNHLHQNGKQLVLTSDKAPSELNGVEERLLTRFRWGLTTKMESPDEALRMAILRNKVQHDGLSIPDEVLWFVAQNVTDNARDLEGVIVSLMAHSVVYGREVDMDMARRVIGQTIRKIEKRKLSASDIEALVCEHFNVKAGLIHTASRKREIVQARQVTMYLLKQHTDMSLAQIGGLIGKKNHATVLHACKTVKNQLEVDKAFRNDVELLENRINKS